MKFHLILLISALAAAAQGWSQHVTSIPQTADEVVAKMIEHDNQRQAALHGYTAIRRYTLENPEHHKRAEMLVRVNCLDNGAKEFQTISTVGWGAARSHVFPRLLESEREASLPGVRERSRITPQNYSFEMIGRASIDGRPAYVMAITPKTPNKYLMEGKIWVDAEEYAILRIEGRPAKNPSFWIKSVHFVHTYQKTGSYWFPVSDRSVTDARILGATELTIEYFDYTWDPASLAISRGVALIPPPAPRRLLWSQP